MSKFQPFLEAIEDRSKKERMEEILGNIKTSFPFLCEELKWNQPMYSNNGTFIIGFSISKAHISVAPEAVVMEKFEDDIKNAGYTYTKELFRIKFTDKVDYDLLYKIVAYNIETKKDIKTFWRQ